MEMSQREMIFFGLQAVEINPLPIDAKVCYYIKDNIDDKRTP